jgi:hypothetical protein
VAETGTHVGKTEPVVALAGHFEAELDLPLASAEAGVTPDEFRRLLSRVPKLARILGPLATPGGTVQRQTWISAFNDLMLAMNLRIVSGTTADLGTTFAAPADLPAGEAVFLRDQQVKAASIYESPTAKLTQPFTINGANVEHGLFTVPPNWRSSAKVSYEIKKRYRWLDGAVGMADNRMRSFSALTFRVVGDGKPLYTSRPLRQPGEREDFLVDVTGVDQLELFVDCPSSNTMAHGVWIDPKLSVNKPKRPPPPAAANLGPGTPAALPGKLLKATARASGVWQQETPDRAFDGDTKTTWGAGGWPEQWIECDLQARTNLGSLRMMTAQGVWSGETVHEVWVSDKPLGASRGEGRLVHTFRGNTSSGDWLQVLFTPGVPARYVQIRSTKSMSWISWAEIELRSSE